MRMRASYAQQAQLRKRVSNEVHMGACGVLPRVPSNVNARNIRPRALSPILRFPVRRRMRMPSDAADRCVGRSPLCALRTPPLRLARPPIASALASAASIAARLLPPLIIWLGGTAARWLVFGSMVARRGGRRKEPAVHAWKLGGAQSTKQSRKPLRYGCLETAQQLLFKSGSNKQKL